MNSAPLILHVLYRLATGGLENGVVNLINHMPAERFRHAILAVDTSDARFAARIRREDVPIIALHKPPGHAVGQYPRVVSIMRRLRPSIVHSRNLAAMELQVPALLSGAAVRIHGEHGRDVDDLEGLDRGKQRLRRLYSPIIHRYVAVSRDLQRYLVDRVGIKPQRVSQIFNGVDTTRFRPPTAGVVPIPGCPFDPATHWLVGTVGRLQAVKNQPLLVKAFALALAACPSMRTRARLAIVGSGPLGGQLTEAVHEAGIAEQAWLAGDRDDVPGVMRGLHVFVLPSMAEGISNTILEAMASGLPVVATNVGGNAELVDAESTGHLVPAGDAQAISEVLVRLFLERDRSVAMGEAGRKRATELFSIDAMVRHYVELYSCELERRTDRRAA